MSSSPMKGLTESRTKNIIKPPTVKPSRNNTMASNTLKIDLNCDALTDLINGFNKAQEATDRRIEEQATMIKALQERVFELEATLKYNGIES